MKLERGQAGHCRDPKSCPRCLDSGNQWDMGALCQRFASPCVDRVSDPMGPRMPS